MYSNSLRDRVESFARTLPFEQRKEFFEILRQQDSETFDSVRTMINQTFKTNDQNLPKVQ